MSRINVRGIGGLGGTEHGLLCPSNANRLSVPKRNVLSSDRECLGVVSFRYRPGGRAGNACKHISVSGRDVGGILGGSALWDQGSDRKRRKMSHLGGLMICERLD